MSEDLREYLGRGTPNKIPTMGDRAAISPE